VPGVLPEGSWGGLLGGVVPVLPGVPCAEGPGWFAFDELGERLLDAEGFEVPLSDVEVRPVPEPELEPELEPDPELVPVEVEGVVVEVLVDGDEVLGDEDGDEFWFGVLVLGL
jgi:hypothetical protein